MQNLYERLQHVRKQLNKSYGDLGDLVGVSEGAIRAAFKNENLKPFYINIFCEKLEISKAWLESGEGDWQNRQPNDMRSVSDYLKKEAKSDTGGMIVDYKELSTMYVPLITQYGYAGYLQGFSDPEYIEELPKIPWAGEREYKGEYICIQVKGDSMSDDSVDAIVEGDVLLCRNIRQDYWKSKLHINKWDFAIVHKELGIVIKRIIKHDVDAGILTLHSLNDYYEDYDVSIYDIAQIFNIVDIQRKRKRR